MKKIFMLIGVIILIAGLALFIYRNQIIRYSAEALIRKSLPDFIKISRVNFDSKNGKVTLNGFKIINPGNFSDDYLLEIKEITCSYRLKGKNILDGFEIIDPVLISPLLNIERRSDGKLNLIEMQTIIGKKDGAKAPGSAEGKQGTTVLGDKKVSDIIKLPEDFLIKGGKIIFIDSPNNSKPHIITLENIEARLSLKLNDYYAGILDVGSTGSGNINGKRDEAIKWVVRYNPTTPKITMSNRFEVSNVAITPFEPYYDKYSPFIFKDGVFSGVLVFDFDNGNIGSTNEIHLRNLKFMVKQDYDNAQLWDTTVPDLVKYFTSPFGEIVFDFKIKGEMSNPKFYLGPISKQALASMAIDKISSAIQKATVDKGKGGLDRADEYIDIIKSLVNKK